MNSNMSSGAIILALTLAAAVPANAGATGFYVEAGAGMSAGSTDDGLVQIVQDELEGATNPDVDESSFRRTADKRAAGFALAAGYRVAPNLAIEMAYLDLGKFSRGLVVNSTSGPVGFNVSTKVSGFAATLVGLWSFDYRITLDARTGLYSLHVSKTNPAIQIFEGSNSFTAEEDGSGSTLPDRDEGVLLGLGATWSFTSSLALRLGYTYFDNINSELNLQRFGLGLKYSF